MPMSSAEISQIAGGYQQQALQNMQYAQMIGQYGFQAGQQYRGMPNDMRMGNMMNTAGAFMPAAASIGMAAMGVDPLQMAWKAGKIGYASGGLSGGLMGAAAGAGVGMAATGAVAYMGHQFMEGAGQQQALNGALRSSFTHISPYGRGFERGEMGQIGGLMRSMTGEYGVTGQMTNMGELTSLAQNMGRMGMGRGISDVQEFSKKFRELVTTVKAVATELGTSLEGAQSMIQGLRGSGVFKAHDQLKMLGLAKHATVGGNISMDEALGMGSIGSQIGRSIGGRARAGMVAGLKTAGMIGGAFESGVLSEEEIYDATGAEGQAGRQALGSTLMQLNASFLRTTRGRRMVAALADKGGQLNGKSLNEYLDSGGFGIGDTGRNVGKNLGAVGRAGFIRNEGRLRGEILAADPLVGIRQTMAWLDDKGYDMNSDYGKIALQRQLKAGGMNVGREEMDALVKLVNNSDNIAGFQKDRASQQRFLEKVGEVQKTTGISGLRMKVDHAKHDVESTFQKVGQDFFNAGSDALDRFVSGITKAYVQRYSQEAQEAFREGARGNASQWEAMFGKGGSLIRASGGLSKRSSADLYSQLSGAGDIGRLREAGYYVGGSDTAGQLKYANEVARGARSMDSSLFMQGKEKRDDIREAMARGQISGRGLDLVRSTEQFMLESMGGDKAAIHQAQRLMEGTVGGYDRGRRAKSYLAGAQVSTGSDFAVPELNMEYLMNGMNGRTLRERGELIGRSVFGNKESFGEENYGLRSGNKWNPADALKVGASAAYRGLADLVGYDPLQSKHRDAGMFMDSTDGRGLMRDMFSDDESKRKTAFEKNTDRRIELQRAMSNGTKLSDAEKGELQARGALADASRIRDEVAKGKSPEEAAAEIAKKVKGFDAKQALNAYHGSRAVASQEAIDQVRQVARDIGKEGRAARDELKASGGLSENENNGGLEMSDALRKTLAGNDQLRNYVEDRIAGINKSVEAGNATDDLGRYEATTEAMNFEGGARKRLRTMSTADLKAGAAKLAEAGAGALASDMSRQARRQSRFEKDLQRGGLSAVTNALGIELDDETKKGLRGKSAEEQARTILEQQGITDNASIYSLTSAISGQYGKGKDASKITSGERLAQLDNVLKPLQEAKKKDKEANDRQSNPLLAKVADGIDAMSKGIKITETVQIKAAEPLRVTVEKP